MQPRAGQRRGGGTASDADGLDSRNRHDGLGEASIELAIPLDVAAEAGRHVVRDHLEAAAHRVAGVARPIDFRDHPLLDGRVDAAERRIGSHADDVLERHREMIGERHGSDREHMAGEIGLDVPEHLPGDSAGGDARGGFTGARPLQYVANVVVAVLDRAGQIGVARPRTGDGRPIGA